MNLDDILADLEKRAGFPFENKDEGKDKDKDKDGKDKKSEGADGDKDKNDKKEPEGGEGGKIEKSAAFKSGSDLANEIMEKVASVKINTNINKGEDNMNKQASDAGKALAQALLKQAGIGDMNTDNGIMPGVVPHKSLVDQAAQKAEHDNSFQPTPGTDGLGNGGTINQIFDAIVADAMGKNVKDENETGNTAHAEGAPVARQTPNQAPADGTIGDDSVEKSAAVSTLVQSGYDFNDAVEMVKQASDLLEAEQDAFIKQAAMSELIEQGVSFDDAVEMVKSASAVSNAAGAVKRFASTAANSAKTDYKMLKNHGHYASSQVKGAGGRMAARAGGVAAAGAGAAALAHEKKAAMNQLMDHGVDFDSAVELVNQKSYELYGA